MIWNGSGVDVAYGGPGNDVLHALADDSQLDVLDCGPGNDVAYVRAHDPIKTYRCEKVFRLSDTEAATMTAANDGNG